MAVARTPTTLAATLQTIADAAPRLRRAGVNRVAVGEVTIDLVADAPAAAESVGAGDAAPEVVLGDVHSFRGAEGRS